MKKLFCKDCGCEIEDKDIYCLIEEKPKLCVCKTCEVLFRNTLEDEIMTDEDDALIDKFFEEYAPGIEELLATKLQNDRVPDGTVLTADMFYIMIKQYRSHIMMLAMDDVYWSTDGEKRLLVRDDAKHELAKMAVELGQGPAGLRELVEKLVAYVKTDDTYEEVDMDYLKKVFG